MSEQLAPCRDSKPLAWDGLLAISIFVTIFATPNRLARLPLRAIIRDDLGLEPDAMARFFALAGLAWYLKPLAGLLVDHVSLGRHRRRDYLMLSGFGGAAVWLAAALSPSSAAALLVCMTIVNCAAVLGNAAAGGLLVDVGRTQDRLSQVSVVRVAVMNLGSLIAGPVGGFLAGQTFELTAVGGAGLCAAMGLFSIRTFGRVPHDTHSPIREGVVDAVRQLRRPDLLSVAAVTLAFYAAPGISSAFYYHQRGPLGLSDQTIGALGALACLGGLIGAMIYARLGPRVRLGILAPSGILLCSLSALAYVVYDSLGRALWLEPLCGLCFVLGVMPLHELAARASPPTHEAFGFAFILALGNAGIALSDVLGASIGKHFELSLQELIVVNACATLASLGPLLLVPRRLLGVR